MLKLISLFITSFSFLYIVAQQQTASTIYEQFKQTGFQFPKPQQRDTIDVGSFDYSNGTFTGIKSIEIQRQGKGREYRPYNVQSQSPQHVLKFRVVNYSLGYVVKVNGSTYQSTQGMAELFILLQYPLQGSIVRWTIQAGGKEFENGFKLIKIPFVAAGVFRIPYLVVAVIYEPSPDINKFNYAQYGVTTFQGTSINLAFGYDQNTTIPAKNTDLQNFKSLLDFSGSALSSSTNPKAKIAGIALMVLGSSLDGYTASTKTGRTVNGEINISVANIESIGPKTPEPNQGGPGFGDIIYCLRDCKFLWLVRDATFSTTLIDVGGTFSPRAITLKEKINNSNNADSTALFKAIASFDPFIRDAKFRPDKKRFSEPFFMECVDSEVPADHTYSTTNSDKNGAIRYTINTEDYVQGWGSYIGLSSGEGTKTVTTTVTNSYSKTEYTGETVTSTINLNGPCKNYWRYYDRVFGTFLVTDVPPLYLEATHTGTYHDTYGNPVPNQKYKMIVNGKTFETMTNEKGEYKFYNKELKNYKAVNVIKGKQILEKRVTKK